MVASLNWSKSPRPGALFRITLPLAAEDAAAAGNGADQPQGERILVVDDEVDVGESLGEILDALGHRVTVTASALQGLEMLKAEPFDRVFVDLRMPEISGHEFLRELQAMQPAVAARSVLMTGDTVRGPATLLGGVDVRVMEKPFSFEDIRAALKPLPDLAGLAGGMAGRLDRTPHKQNGSPPARPGGDPVRRAC